MKVLIAEADAHIRNGLAEIYRNEGYQTFAAADGREAMVTYHKELPDIVCLDVMLPEINGYDVCREIRRHSSNVPVIFLSPKSEEVDKETGLELGADDFILKPFGIREVEARIRAVTRRYWASQHQNERPPSFRMDDLEVFPADLRARRGDEIIELSLRDTKILELFYQHKGETLSRDTIFRECWGKDYLPDTDTLDRQISQLRERIEVDSNDPSIIRTVHGVGYRYE